MLILYSTDVIRIVTDAAAAVDVHASWADNNAGAFAVGRTPTKITTATTTTIVAAPTTPAVRTVTRLNIRNTSTATTVTVTVEFYDGTNAIQLEKRVLGPGATLKFTKNGGFTVDSTGGPRTRPWDGINAGAQGDGDPGRLLSWVQIGSIISPTAANISTTVARCSSFMLPADLVVNRIRCYGVATLVSTLTVAIYRMSDLARVSAAFTFSTTAGAWTSIGSAMALTLSKDVVYFIAVGANAATATAGPAAFSTTVAATTGQINTIPSALPGSLAMGATAYQAGALFQFAVTAGAMPNPAPALAAQAAWTGGMPAMWLDNSDT